MTIRHLLEKGVIGSEVRITASKNQTALGVAGTIIDETRNMLRVKTKEGERRFIKDQHTFEIAGLKIEGVHLVGRPEERIKKWLRKSKITRTSGSK